MMLMKHESPLACAPAGVVCPMADGDGGGAASLVMAQRTLQLQILPHPRTLPLHRLLPHPSTVVWRAIPPARNSYPKGGHHSAAIRRLEVGNSSTCGRARASPCSCCDVTVLSLPWVLKQTHAFWRMTGLVPGKGWLWRLSVGG